jgi:hypothetical protein
MADTTILKSKVEDCVRTWLEERFWQQFLKLFLPLSGVQGRSPRIHEFDAVSKDASIVCGIRTASWKTAGGKRGSGKVQGAYAKLYFLSLVEAKERYLVLTDPEFFRCFSEETEGRLVTGVSLLYCPLPEDLCTEIESVRAASRAELGSNLTMRTPVTIRTKDYYVALRNCNAPRHPTVIFIAESPPASGKFFYNPDGSVSEPLFKAMMEDVLGIKPTSKEEGLKKFAAHGFFLLDATYTPVNKLAEDAADEMIRNDFPRLLADLREHARPETRIVLVKANVCRILEPKLHEVGFNVLNNGTIIPFPDRFHARGFRDAVRQVLGL